MPSCACADRRACPQLPPAVPPQPPSPPRRAFPCPSPSPSLSHSPSHSSPPPSPLARPLPPAPPTPISLPPLFPFPRRKLPQYWHAFTNGIALSISHSSSAIGIASPIRTRPDDAAKCAKFSAIFCSFLAPS